MARPLGRRPKRARLSVPAGGRELAAQAAQLADRLCFVAYKAGWSGPDPYDALWWGGWPSVLTGRKLGRQLLIQLHARSPVDFRPLYRRRHPVISKTLAVFGAAATRLHIADGRDGRHVEVARDALGRLAVDYSSATPGFGYPFAVQTRWSFYPAQIPNAIATAFGGLALAEGGRAFQEPRWEERAERAAEWALEALWHEPNGWFVYHPQSRALIHNANLLVARLVWRLAGGDVVARERVGTALARTLDAEKPDGTFPYGEGGGLQWADSFHTGYVLESLAELIDLDPSVGSALRRGAESYLARFFGPAGEAYLWPDRPYPQDGHSAGTALTTLSALAARGVIEAERIDPIARRVVTHVVRDGHAVHRRHRLGATRVAYVRWCDAHVALGLASYALVR
jgi:hypothetical protein